MGEREDLSHLLEHPAFQRVGHAVVVDPDTRPLGIISLTDVERFLRASTRSHGRDSVPHLAPHA